MKDQANLDVVSEGQVWFAELETSSYTFVAIGSSLSNAKKAMATRFNDSCKANLIYPAVSFADYAEEVTYALINLNQAYRYGEM